jgi:hypothetical protein
VDNNATNAPVNSKDSAANECKLTEKEATVARLRKAFIRNNSTYVQTWLWELAFTDEKPVVKHVGMTYAMFAGPDGEDACPGLRSLSTIIGVRKTTISECRARLLEIGFLYKTGERKTEGQFGRKTDVLRLNIPKPTSAPHGETNSVDLDDIGSPSGDEVNFETTSAPHGETNSTDIGSAWGARHYLEADAKNDDKGEAGSDGRDGGVPSSPLSSDSQEGTSGGCGRVEHVSTLTSTVEICNSGVVS